MCIDMCYRNCVVHICCEQGWKNIVGKFIIPQSSIHQDKKTNNQKHTHKHVTQASAIGSWKYYRPGSNELYS